MKFNSISKTAFRKFLNENKSLKIMLPFLVVGIIVLIVFSVSGGFKNDGQSIPSSQNSEDYITADGNISDDLPRVEVLPQTIRSNPEVKKDPFEAVMKLVGIISSEKKSTAIIEWGEYSYIVQTDEKVGDSDWRVSKIGTNSITLVSGNDSLVLELTDGSNNNSSEGINNND